MAQKTRISLIGAPGAAYASFESKSSRGAQNFVSVQAGNWNDAETWGDVDYPSIAGDTVTIGHEVRYNVSNSRALGEMTIASGGILNFMPDMNTKVALGHQDIVIQSGGELRVGNLEAPILKDQTAELVWSTTADNVKGINIANGGKLTIYGDPDHYGSNDIAELAADWTAGQTFTVVGDYTALWQAGQPITVHRGTDYSAYNTDTVIVSIASMALNGGNTEITIAQTFPGGTFYASGRVTNVGRNVKFYKNLASGAIGNYNTNRPRILDNNGILNQNVHVKDAQFVGFHSINTKYNPVLESVVFRNGRSFIETTSGINIQASGRVFSCASALIGTALASSTDGLDIFACYTAITGFYETKLTGEIYSNYIGLYNATLVSVTGNLFANELAIVGGTGLLLFGGLGYDAGEVMKRNLVDIYMLENSFTEVKMRGVLMPPDPVIANRNTFSAKISVSSENHLRVLGAHYRWKQFGDIIRNTTVLRPGGAGDTIEVVPLSNCAGATPLSILEWDEFDVPATEQTRFVYVRGEGWTVWPEASRLYLSAEYIDDAHTLATAKVLSTQVLSDNKTWTKFSVTFKPSVKGTVRYVMQLSKYQAGAKVYVDNQLN
ncbi:MAG: hypothetical protein C4542_07360 [Dehalococcoidia bacterium]|nr:MAG: hypothetical protein C4542_07360 [Dehalococcoidia bacterium]